MSLLTLAELRITPARVGRKRTEMRTELPAAIRPTAHLSVLADVRVQLPRDVPALRNRAPDGNVILARASVAASEPRLRTPAENVTVPPTLAGRGRALMLARRFAWSPRNRATAKSSPVVVSGVLP